MVWLQSKICSAMLIAPELTTQRILEEQQKDAVLQQVIQHLSSQSRTPKPNWKPFPLKRYSQLLQQLHVVGGVLCLSFVPGPLVEIITVPVIPNSLQEMALHNCHDVISAGHQGTEKTLDRLKRMWPTGLEWQRQQSCTVKVVMCVSNQNFQCH